MSRTLNLTCDTKRTLLELLSAYDIICDVIRNLCPEFENLPSEKCLCFLRELRTLTRLEEHFGEEFRLYRNVYSASLDAESETRVVQLKELGGYTANSSKINMKSGVLVEDYVENMKSNARGKQAYLVVQNNTQKQICITPITAFNNDSRTFISWNDLKRDPRTVTIPA